MNRQRYVVALEGHGRIFRMALHNLNIPSVRHAYQDKDSDLDFVYKDCTSQAMMAMGEDVTAFLPKLMVLPELGAFRHIPVLNDPETSRLFVIAFREYAFMLASIIQRKVGFTQGTDYLLESVAEDYMVIMQVTYNNQLRNSYVS